jgi:predicted nucleic acid-binding protein
VGASGIAVVSDAGPLIHLAEIECLSLLSLFERLHIPGAVWRETVGQARVSGSDILEVGNVQQHTLSVIAVDRFVAQHRLEKLHSGERECLYLCRQIGVSVLLTDDLAVRESAQRLGLTPVGSLGVVVRAYHIGRLSLSSAEQHIIALYETSSLFVTRTIVDLAIEQLHKRAK